MKVFFRLALALDRLIARLDRGLQAVIRAVRDRLPNSEAADAVAGFHASRLVERQDASISCSTIYEHYCDWCKGSNTEPLALPHFAKGFDGLGVRKARIAGRVYWLDVAFKGGRPDEPTKTPTYQVDAA